jgi:hypothetical protein
LSPDELAALAQVNRKTVMNLMAPSGGSGLRSGPDGKIPLEDARRWLLTRPEFRPSIWQRQKGKMAWPDSRGELAGDPMFVPAMEDGTWFSPVDSLVKAGGSRTRESLDGKRIYRVGDQDYDDYWRALEALHRMEVPKWRQLDAIGRAREKTGTRWLRRTRQELEELLSSLPQNVRRRKGRKKAP